METIVVGILMLFPAVFILLLIAGGAIMVSFWVFAHLPPSLTGKTPAKVTKPYRNERRSGSDRRHQLTEKTGQHTSAAA